jgi:YggT family protein
MDSTYFTNPLVFLIGTAFDLYIAAVILRFLLQWVRADFYNPVSQFLVKATNPPLIPLRRLLPGIGGIDLASLVLMLILAITKWLLLSVLHGAFPGIVSLLVLAIAEVIKIFIGIYFFSIIIQVILSWVSPHQYNPVSVLLYQLNEPLLRPIRRLLPPTGGFDLSPLLALVLLQLSKMILLPPLYMFAQ